MNLSWLVILIFFWQISYATLLQIVLIGERNDSHLFAAAILGVEDNLKDKASFIQIYIDQDNFLDNICQLNSSSVDAVIDISPSYFGSEDIAMHMDALLISFKDWYPNLPLNMYSVPSIKPSSTQYIQSVVSFINSLNGSLDSVMILFSKSFALDSNFILPLQNTQTFVPVYMKEVNSSSVSDAIGFIKQQRVSNIILASDFNLGTVIIKQALDAGFLNGIFHWYFVTKDLSAFSCPLCINGGFLLFQKVIENTALFNRIMAVNPSLTQTDQAIEMVYAYQSGQVLAYIIGQSLSAGTWVNSSSSFSCWKPSVNTTIPSRYNMGLNMIKKIEMPGVFGKIVFNQTNRNQFAKIVISEISVGLNPSIISNVVWTSSNGLSGNNVSKNLVSKMLKVLVIHEPPFVIKLSNNTFIGYSIDVLAYLADAMNFKYQIFEQVDSQYGIALNNGTFTGLIGAMTSNQYDMAIGAITITGDRELVVDFSIPYFEYSAIQILMKVVTASTQGDQLFFLKAFTWDVWVTVIATILCTGFLISFVDRVSPFSFQNRLKNNQLTEGECDGKVFTIKESLWFVLGAYTQAGESFDPRSVSCRVIVVGLWLFAYLMMAMYTANLSAQLTVAQLASRPGSLTELAAQQTMTYTTQSNTSIYDYFYRMKNAESDIFNYWIQRGVKNLNNPAQSALMSTWQYPVTDTYTEMFNKMSAWGFTANISDSIKKIINNDWAIFLETPIIKYYTNMDCRLVAVGDPFSQRPYGIVLQQNSPLLNNLNLKILIMQRDRLFENFKVKWWNNNSVVCNVNDPSSGLGLNTLGGAFVFLAIGIVIAGIIFLFEKLIAHIWGTEWAKIGANDATVVRPMGIMSTVNINNGSHIERDHHAHHSRKNSSINNLHPITLSTSRIESYDRNITEDNTTTTGHGNAAYESEDDNLTNITKL